MYNMAASKDFLYRQIKYLILIATDNYSIGTICIFFNVKPSSSTQLIADAGYQGEITSASSAAHQPEVFCGLIKSLLTDIITAPSTSEMEDSLKEFCVSKTKTFTCTCTFLHM